jgi:hypothetical protein
VNDYLQKKRENCVVRTPNDVLDEDENENLGQYNDCEFQNYLLLDIHSTFNIE